MPYHDQLNPVTGRPGEKFDVEGDSPRGIQTAGSLDYNQLRKYIDATAGNIIDPMGLMRYIKKVSPEFYDTLGGDDKLNKLMGEGFGKRRAIRSLTESLAYLPGLNIDPGAYRAKQSEFLSGVGSLTEQIGAKRAQSLSETGIGGVYGLGDPLEGGDFKNIYGDISEATGSTANLYGLGTEKEKEFIDWMASTTESLED